MYQVHTALLKEPLQHREQLGLFFIPSRGQAAVPKEARGGPRNSDSLLRWDPDPGAGVWHATEETALSG